jgi:hypothetical protein
MRMRHNNRMTYSREAVLAALKLPDPDDPIADAVATAVLSYSAEIARATGANSPATIHLVLRQPRNAVEEVALELVIAELQRASERPIIIKHSPQE